MKTLPAILFGALLTMLIIGAVYIAAAPPHGRPIQLLPTITAAPLYVDVDGEVLRPGVYTLPVDSRMIDAVVAAGGLTEQADRNRVNLAAPLVNGQKIIVPAIGQASVDAQTSPEEQIYESGSRFPIDLNSADADLLQELPGIGPTKAADICSYREAHGPFTSIEQLLNVPGIGESTLNQLLDYVTLGQ
jgi:competence protein ComEA